MERRQRFPHAEVRVHEAPRTDAAVWLLLAAVFVLLALAVGTGLALLLPPAL
jgi:hypothetical protein